VQVASRLHRGSRPQLQPCRFRETHAPPEPAGDADHAPVAERPNAAADEPAVAQQEDLPTPMDWYKQWYPVAVLRDLDARRPTGVQLLGQELVVWRDGSGVWRAAQDKCPHRLAPL